MRRWIVILSVLVLALAAVGAGVGLAEDPAAKPQTQRTLDVSGRGTIKATPDTAIITVGVSSLADTATEAYRQTAKAANELAATLKQFGVKAEEIRTTELSLYPEYNWTQEKGQVLRGYRSATSLSVTTQDLEGVGLLVETMVGKGANSLQSIRFTVKDPEKLIEQATDLAVDNAMGKASRVANRMGTQVIGVLRVSVMDTGGSMERPMPAAYETKSAMGADAAMPVFGGTSEYTVTISATFEIK